MKRFCFCMIQELPSCCIAGHCVHVKYCHNTLYIRLAAFFRDNLGKPAPER